MTNAEKRIVLEDCDPRMDNVENACVDFIVASAKEFGVELSYADVQREGYDTGAIPDIRDAFVKFLKSIGCTVGYRTEMFCAANDCPSCSYRKDCRYGKEM